MAGKLRPVRVGDVYQIGATRFEVTAFDLMGHEPIAIGVETSRGASIEVHARVVGLRGRNVRLISGGMGQAVEVEP